MNNLCLIVNTVSKNHDIWKMFFDQINKFVTSDFFHKKYIFVDNDLEKIPDDYEVIRYDSNFKYRDQFVSCIDHVQEEYCIYISEDYVLYNHIDEEKIKYFKKALSTNPSLSFIKTDTPDIFLPV